MKTSRIEQQYNNMDDQNNPYIDKLKRLREQAELSNLYDYGKARFMFEWLSPPERAELDFYILERTEKSKSCNVKDIEKYFGDYLKNLNLYDHFVAYLQQLLDSLNLAKQQSQKPIPTSN